MFYFFKFLYTIYMQRVCSYVTCNDEMTGLLAEGREMDIAYLEFRKDLTPSPIRYSQRS